jgi:hypothetical protein
MFPAFGTSNMRSSMFLYVLVENTPNLTRGVERCPRDRTCVVRGLPGVAV